MKKSVVYYGTEISAEGVQATEEWVNTIRRTRQPRDISELQCLLGMVPALSSFAKDLSTIARPLNELLGNKPWNGTHNYEHAFKKVKEAITTETVLAHYNPKLPVELAADASQYGVGAAVMHVYPDNTHRPVAYASRSLNDNEKRYGQIEKEELAIIFGLQRHRMYLYS